MELTILAKEDYPALFLFETENRLFFEQSVPSRGAAYFYWDSFCTQNDDLLKEQAEGKGLFFLIKDDKKEIIGRLNLSAICLKEKRGTLGYRIAESASGQGVAQAALRLFLASHEAKGLERINAQTTSDNLASQKILLKNQFVRIAEDKEAFLFNGKEKHFAYYQWERKETDVN